MRQEIGKPPSLEIFVRLQRAQDREQLNNIVVRHCRVRVIASKPAPQPDWYAGVQVKYVDCLSNARPL